MVSASKQDRGVAISAVFLFSIVALLFFFPAATALGLSSDYGGLWAGLAVNDLSSSVAVGSQFGGNAEVLAARLKVYHDNTAPVLPYYEDKGQLVTIDGMQPVEEVNKQIEACLNSVA